MYKRHFSFVPGSFVNKLLRLQESPYKPITNKIVWFESQNSNRTRLIQHNYDVQGQLRGSFVVINVSLSAKAMVYRFFVALLLKNDWVS